MSRITAGDYEKLSAPFPVDDHKFRVLKKSKNGDTALWYAYVDARDVQARLSSVDLDWESKFRLLDMTGELAVVECELTVLGVTRCDVGTDDRNKIDGEGNYVKGAYSDALKRAAVNFGVGKYLYSLRNWYLPIDNFGNFTDDSLSKMRSALVSDLAKLGVRPGSGNGDDNGNGSNGNVSNGNGGEQYQRHASDNGSSGNGVQHQRQSSSNGSNGNGVQSHHQETSSGSNGGGQRQANAGGVTAKDLLLKFRADTSGATPEKQLVPLKINIGKTIGTRGDEYLGIISVILGWDLDPDNPEIPRNMSRELMDFAPEVTGKRQSDGKWADVPNPKHNPVYTTLVREAWKTYQEREGVPFPT